MAIERLWESQAPLSFMQDGGQNGLVTTTKYQSFKVKQKVILSSATQPDLLVQVKKVLSPTKFLVGPVKDQTKPQKPANNLLSRLDISNYRVSEGASVRSSEQNKVRLDPRDIIQAAYEQEPTLAHRVFNVDSWGRPWAVDNPFPVQLSDGEINIGTVNAELEVQLSHKDNFPDTGDVRDAVNVVDNFLIKRFEKINNVTYEGLADQGSLPSEAKWRITRTVKQPNGDLVTSIVGDTSYDQVWNNRASLFSPVTPTEFFDRKWEKILPILNNANFLKLGNFDSLVPSFAGDIATLNYFEGGANIARIKVRYVHELDWDMNLEAFINDTNGDILLDDDGTSLILE